MIQETKCYCGRCDNCQELFTTYDEGYTLFVDKDEVRCAMDDEGWYTGVGDPDHVGKYYCDECFKWHPEEDDKIILNTERTKLL
jgi:hypothetical protein